MYVWRKNSWYLGIIFLIGVCINLSLVSGKNISVEYDCVETKEFKIKIELKEYPKDIYDVKIDILFRGKRIAEIYDKETGWKSTYYYVNNIINTNEKTMESFELRLKEEVKGEADMIIKIRDSKENVESYDYILDLNYEEGDGDKEEENVEIREDTDNENEEDKEIENRLEEDNRKEIKNNKTIEENEVIILKRKDINTNNNKNKIREYAIYFFAGFCVFLLIVLIWKRKSDF